MDFWYDGQVRRYLLQFMRIFSDIKIETGPDDNGVKTQRRVPIIYGDPSWMVAQILNGQTENTMIPSPIFSAWIANLELTPERRYSPTHESTVTAAERNWDKDTNTYGSKIGTRYTIDRYMPVPYKLTCQLDCWTTTTTTKLQILEQILTIFNPSLQLQVTSNALDWTNTFEVELENIQWTNRSVPAGSEMDRDVFSLTFGINIWISPPAKVKQYRIIEEIVTNIKNLNDVDEVILNKNIEDPLGSISNISRVIVTPGDFKLGVEIKGAGQGQAILLNKYGVADPTLSWRDLFLVYGDIEEYETAIRLKTTDDLDDLSTDIIVYFTIDQNKPNIINVTIDEETLPSTTMEPVLSIVDGITTWPGNNLPAATIGQRYLLNNKDNERLSDSNQWGIIANDGDIIEFDGTEWFVDFENSPDQEFIHYIVNLDTLEHLKWDNYWQYTYQGEYAPGLWRLENLISNDNEENSGGGDLPFINNGPCSPQPKS